jgi:hypothetical protein
VWMWILGFDLLFIMFLFFVVVVCLGSEYELEGFV